MVEHRLPTSPPVCVGKGALEKGPPPKYLGVALLAGLVGLAALAGLAGLAVLAGLAELARLNGVAKPIGPVSGRSTRRGPGANTDRAGRAVRVFPGCVPWALEVPRLTVGWGVLGSWQVCQGGPRGEH